MIRTQNLSGQWMRNIEKGNPLSLVIILHISFIAYPVVTGDGYNLLSGLDVMV